MRTMAVKMGVEACVVLLGEKGTEGVMLYHIVRDTIWNRCTTINLLPLEDAAAAEAACTSSQCSCSHLFRHIMSSSITLLGATGLTGNATLHALLSSPNAFSITTFTRRPIDPSTPPLVPSFYPPVNPKATHTNRVFPDLFVLPAEPKIADQAGIYASCLGTTRGAAGSFAAQEKLDLHLNLDLAKRAKQDGAETVHLILPFFCTLRLMDV
jgi:hypothetical protein